jgi:hypothetical protein
MVTSSTTNHKLTFNSFIFFFRSLADIGVLFVSVVAFGIIIEPLAEDGEEIDFANALDNVGSITTTEEGDVSCAPKAEGEDVVSAARPLTIKERVGSVELGGVEIPELLCIVVGGRAGGADSAKNLAPLDAENVANFLGWFIFISFSDRFLLIEVGLTGVVGPLEDTGAPIVSPFRPGGGLWPPFIISGIDEKV